MSCTGIIRSTSEGRSFPRVPDARSRTPRAGPLLLTLLLILALVVPLSAAASSGLDVTVRNLQTGQGIAGARVYLDGEFRGLTDGTGTLVIPFPADGEHTLRATKAGFSGAIATVQVPGGQGAVISLRPQRVIPLGTHGPPEERMDIVFVASDTQYDCRNQAKVSTDYYTAHPENFVNDTQKIIDTRFMKLDTLTSKHIGIPADFKERFNFYYYWDPDRPADAFSECAGTLPEGFWEDAPFTDVAVILYPTYKGSYTGPPCEPNGCAVGMGPGIHSWFKIPGDSGSLILHEAGHVVFGLVDTYCGESTYYTQNEPDPNVWKSRSGCTFSAAKNTWNPLLCRPLGSPEKAGKTVTCPQDYWRIDAEPDLMEIVSPRARFGNASTLHIKYIFNNINRWST